MPPASLLLPLSLFLPLASPSTGETRDRDWLELDRVLAPIADLSEREGEIRYGALLRAFYAYSSDDVTVPGADDLSGFALDDADVFFEAELGETTARLSLDVGTGEAVLEDAYGRFAVGEWLHLTLGRFKPRVLRSNDVDPDGLLFRDRTVLGARFDVWDLGAELHGDFDPLWFWIALTNGSTGPLNDHLLVVRGEWSLFDPPVVPGEGARGSPNYLTVVFGGVWLRDMQNVGGEDAEAFGGDVNATHGPYSLHAEFLRLDDGAGGVTTDLASTGAPLVFEGETTPWSTTIAWVPEQDERWQVAGRYQNLDDSFHTDVLGGALQFAPAGMGGAVWVLDVSFFDTELEDALVYQLGLQLGASR